MSYQAVPIVTDKTGGAHYIAACRDLDGRLYALLYDHESTPKAGRLYYSDTEGATWSAETWSTSVGASTSDGCTTPTLMVSPDNVVWCGMASYDGTTKPTVIRRISQDERWGQSGGYAGEMHVFSVNAWTSVHFAMDSAHRTQGYYNVCCCGIASNAVRYGDFSLGASDEAVNTTGACSDAHITATAGGMRWVAWIESTTLWVAYKASLTGSWSARAQASIGGQAVSSVEDVAINPATDAPGVLYRADQGGGVHYLYLAEWDPATSAWVQERIWDGSNNRHYYQGCSLAYDRRGSEFVVGLEDYGGLGKAQPCVHAYYSALGATVWAYESLNTGAGGVDVEDTITLGHQCPAVNGFRSGVNYQGLCFWTFVSVAGGAGDQILYWINYDTLNNPRSSYPTKFSNPLGEPYYRDEPDYEGVSVAITGEPTATDPFPLDNAIEQISESQIFQTSVATFEAGWKATIARFPSGRRRLEVETVPLNDTDHSTLRTFLLARAEGSDAFTFTLVDSTSIDVVLDAESLDFTLIGPDVYKVRFVLLEVL